MGEATAKEESGSAAPEQSDAIVGAAGRLEEACRDLTACLRALPGVAERRAAALLLRAAAVSGRLHLKDAIRLLDAAFEEDQDGPLCGEQRVVPETPERSPPAGPADDQSPRVNGAALTSDGEDAGAQNGVADGPAASDDQQDLDASQEVGKTRSKKQKKGKSADSEDSAKASADQVKLKKEKSASSDSDDAAQPSSGRAKSKKKKKGTSSDSDESAKAPAKRTKKRRGDVSEEEEEASAGDDEVPLANSSESQSESGPGLLIANIEPLQEPMDSQEAIVKTEPEVESKEESEPMEDPVDEPDSRLAMSDSDSPAGDNSAMEESEAESAEASPKFQNERDRMALLLSSDGEDGDDPGLDRDGSDAPDEDVLADGDQQDSEGTVIRSGDEKKRASGASSSDDTSRAGRRLRKRAVKEEAASNESASDGGKGKRRGRHRRQAKKSPDSDSDRDVSKILGRRGRDRRERQASESSGDASSDSGPETAQRRERQRVHRRRRRPRGPPEPTADCSVVLRRLPAEIEQEAEENGFVKITKRAKKRLSEETLEIRRLANVAVLLRTSMLKEEGSSDDSDDSDTEKEAEQKKAKKAALRTAKKAEKKKKKTLKDMSDGDSDGRPSGIESDDSNKPSTSALVPMEQNDFDRQQLLASDSASDDDSPAVKDDTDSDFELSDKDKKRLKKKAEKAAKKKSGCEEGKDTDNDDDDDKDKKKRKGKKDSRAKDSSDESNSKETKVKKESDDKDGTESNEDGETEKAKGSKKDKDKKKKNGDEKDDAEEGMDVEDDDGKKSGSNASGSEAGDSKDEKQKSKKMSAKVRKLLNGKMSATDSSEEDEKMKEKILKKRAKEDEKNKDKAGSEKSGDEEDDGPSDGLPQLVDLPSTDEEEVVEKKRSPKKRRMRVVDDSDSDLMLLDSDAADEEEEDAEPSRKRSRSSSSSISSASDSADDFRPPKKTRSRARLKRIRRMSDDSADSSGDDSVEEVKPDSQGTPGKGGRKNIRHIREAEQSTKEASQAELERRKRIEDKQAMYNELFKRNASSDEPAALDKLVLDFDPDTKKPLVTVHKNFVKILKPHQVDGVKFMFDSCIESVKRLDDETNMDNAGCILAHCMGLGKTLQVVVLLHTLMDSKATRGKISCALVVCPKNTVQNWVRELKTWQKKCRVPEVDVVDITFRKDNYERSFELEQWQTEGGVCVLSYDMFKRFCGAGGKKGYVKKQKDRFQSALLDPGPDIVVCDEGHLLKNPRTAAFKSLNQMKCRRRVILTGTPLQNNLREYHTMVEFVKPRLLGSESEFSNRFIRPIENGSAVDALPRDVRLMKRRSHVLHKLLNSVVQRRDYNVLMPFLPPKLEFTLMVKLSELQRKLYESYLEKARSRTTRKVLADFQALSRVWTHPRSIQMKDEQDDVKDEMKSEREAMERFVADSSTSEEEDSKDGSGNGAEAAEGAAPNGETADDSEWWRSCIPDDMQFEDISLSGKLSLLDQLLVKCENIGDKLLVFSQSLFSLNLIEEHLERLHKEMARCRSSDKKHPSHVYFGTWKPDYDYFRLDGSTSEERRQLMCDRINKASNERARLMLISTKAGGLGINLVGANRVVIFDASWNPTADSQAIFRVYRFGQVKPSYVYRFIAQGCMEEKIYDRQISKLSLSCRVVDEQQVERHFSQHDVEELYDFDPERKRTTGLIVPKDDLVLMELVSEQAAWVSSVHGHDSLLQNVADEELNADEQRAAWEEYENDRRGIPNVGDIIPLVEGKAIDKATVIEMIKKDNPTATDNEVLLMIPKAIQTLRAYYFKKQQQEQRAREEQYRQTLELQRQSMYSQHAMQQDARNTNMDPAAYSRLLEMVAAQHAAGASAAASAGAAGASAAHSMNRQTVDRQAYAKLLELMAAHSRPPAAHSGRAPAAVPAVHGNRTVTPAAHSRTPAVPAGQSIGRQRTAHVPGPSHRHHQRVAAAIQRSMGGGGGAGSASSGATGASAGAVALPKSITVLPVNKKPGEDGGKSDKPVKPPDVVDIT